MLVEAGFAWAPSLCWRLDQHWERMRDEVPHVKRPPSEYVREHFWYTTQPMEEPEHPEHLRDIIDWIGWDRLLFSTDYPHWDFDDPRFAFKCKLTREQRAQIFSDNAKALFGLPDGRRGMSSPRSSEIAPGGSEARDSVKGRDIGVFNVNGEFFALLNNCPHAGGAAVPRPIIGLAQSDEPGPVPPVARRASCCAAPGTAGSSTSAPASPGATRTASGSGASR